MNHRVEFLGTKQDNQTTAMIKWDVATVQFPLASVTWLRANILSGGVDNLLPCAMDDGEMRALEDRAERPVPTTKSSSTEPTNSRQELADAQTHGPKVRVRPDPRNPSEAEGDAHNATRLPFRGPSGVSGTSRYELRRLCGKSGIFRQHSAHTS